MFARIEIMYLLVPGHVVDSGPDNVYISPAESCVAYVHIPTAYSFIVVKVLQYPDSFRPQHDVSQFPGVTSIPSSTPHSVPTPPATANLFRVMAVLSCTQR